MPPSRRHPFPSFILLAAFTVLLLPTCTRSQPSASIDPSNGGDPFPSSAPLGAEPPGPPGPKTESNVDLMSQAAQGQGSGSGASSSPPSPDKAFYGGDGYIARPLDDSNVGGANAGQPDPNVLDSYGPPGPEETGEDDKCDYMHKMDNTPRETYEEHDWAKDEDGALRDMLKSYLQKHFGEAAWEKVYNDPQKLAQLRDGLRTEAVCRLGDRGNADPSRPLAENLGYGCIPGKRKLKAWQWEENNQGNVYKWTSDYDQKSHQAAVLKPTVRTCTIRGAVTKAEAMYPAWRGLGVARGVILGSMFCPDTCSRTAV